MSNLLPYQQRVILEKQELDSKISSLDLFLNGTSMVNLSSKELSLLTEQLQIMLNYSSVLQDRISNF